MIKSKILASMCLASVSMWLLAAETHLQSEEALVTSADFTVLAGLSWSGSLSYLDYSSNKEARIPVEIQFDKPGAHKVVYRIRYPGETQYNTTEKLKWSRDGSKINGETITSRSQDSDGTIILVTQFEGKDDNRPADIRMTYSISKSALTISKEVRFEDQAGFFRRNAYELAR